jgi:3,4-dihydroxy 2-butanone 4-phosphate synthase/GTP cyclohydrolase II
MEPPTKSELPFGGGYEVIRQYMDVPLRRHDISGLLMGAICVQKDGTRTEHALIYSPSLESIKNNPIVRINSACWTGDIFLDNRCDCNFQLQDALQDISNNGGLVIYHVHHEGRANGLVHKLHSYALMDGKQLDTFTAMEQACGSKDARTFASSVAVLKHLGITELRLISNSVQKAEALKRGGIRVNEEIRTVSKDPLHEPLLRAKRDMMGHKIVLPEEFVDDAQ